MNGGLKLSKIKFKRNLVSTSAIALIMLGTVLTPLNNTASAAVSSDKQFVYTVLSDGTAQIDNSACQNPDVVIPKEIDGHKVKVIGNYSFGKSYCSKGVKSVTIPNGVETIGDMAFNQQFLTNVKIPDSVTTIGYQAFNSNAITDLVIGDGVKKIDEEAFNNNKISSLKLGNNVEIIGKGAFNTNEISNIKIPDSVTLIGERAFASNYLREVTLPAGLQYLSIQAFGFNKIKSFIVKSKNVSYSKNVLYPQKEDNINDIPTKDIIIKASPGSTSETYATANNHTFVALTDEDTATFAVEKAETSLKQSDVYDANVLITALANSTVKDNLIVRLNAVQDKINNREAIAEATAAVKQAETYLETDDILAAQGLVNALVDSTEKTNLQKRLDALQDSINQVQKEKDATSAIEKAESTHNQTDLDNAKNLVNALPDGTVKDSLKDRLDSVQTIVDENNKKENEQNEKDATTAVEKAESSLDQSDLDNAKNIVAALPDGTLKDNLTDRLGAVQNAIHDKENEEPIKGNSTSNDVDMNLKGGELSLKNANVISFGSVRLSDQPKTVSTSFTNHFTVKDITGNQAGYRVDVSATPFRSGENTLPKGSLSLKPVTSIERVGVGTGSFPESSLSANQIIDNGKVTLVSASEGTGMGVFNLTFPEDALSITVDPTTAKIDGAASVYESTITWDLIQAP